MKKAAWLVVAAVLIYRSLSRADKQTLKSTIRTAALSVADALDDKALTEENVYDHR